MQGTPLLVQACSPGRGLLTERPLGLFEEHAQFLAGRTPCGQAGQDFLGPAAQLLWQRLGQPGGRYRVDGAGLAPEQLGVQVSAALRRWLGLLDGDPVCFGPGSLRTPVTCQQTLTLPGSVRMANSLSLISLDTIARANSPITVS